MRTSLAIRHSRIEHKRPVPTARDENLILRYRDAADGDAFTELVHRYERPLYNYLRRYLGDACLAEDVFQATFLVVHQKCRQFKRERSFRPWLYAIATNQAIDCLRRQRRHHVVSLDATQAGGPDNGALINSLQSVTPSPAAQLEAKERREWAWRAVNKLPKHLRSPVVLTAYHGLEYREAADILGIPVGTVKTRVHTAKAALVARWRRDNADVA